MDDTIIFCKAILKDINTLKVILYSFELLTGLRINFSKSCLIGLDIPSEETSFYAWMLGSSIGQLPIDYLGIPFHSSSLKANY